MLRDGTSFPEDCGGVRHIGTVYRGVKSRITKALIRRTERSARRGDPVRRRIALVVARLRLWPGRENPPFIVLARRDVAAGDAGRGTDLRAGNAATGSRRLQSAIVPVHAPRRARCRADYWCERAAAGSGPDAVHSGRSGPIGTAARRSDRPDYARTAPDPRPKRRAVRAPGSGRGANPGGAADDRRAGASAEARSGRRTDCPARRGAPDANAHGASGLRIAATILHLGAGSRRRDHRACGGGGDPLASARWQPVRGDPGRGVVRASSSRRTRASKHPASSRARSRSANHDTCRASAHRDRMHRHACRDQPCERSRRVSDHCPQRRRCDKPHRRPVN